LSDAAGALPVDAGPDVADVGLPPTRRGPWLPPARDVRIPAGTVRVRELPGPTGAPAVVLLHGWNATADLNFFRCYRSLGEHVRVIAFDQRGHGQGVRSRRAFTLEDCADDVAGVLDALGVERAIPVGYSMGGAIAQLMWHRHRDRVSGLVLTATAGRFSDGREERLTFFGISGLAMVARLTPAQARNWLSSQLYLRRRAGTWNDWALEELAEHDWRMILEAGGALGRFRSDGWIRRIDVPVGVVVPTHDEVVPVRRQQRLAELIPLARQFDVVAGHDAAVAAPKRFMPVLLDALAWVTARS
jgi:3-oxoadipate enol-lactonase